MVAVALFSAVVIAPMQAEAAAPTPAAISPSQITQSVTGGTLSNAAFNLTGFKVVNGVLNATGTLTGSLTNTLTGVTTAVTQAITIPVNLAQTTGSCQILNLVLGPLDLNLLGLVVHLDTIKLNITAQSGPGNLVGNLLCAVAHLLDGGPLGGLAGLLNNLLRNL